MVCATDAWNFINWEGAGVYLRVNPKVSTLGVESLLPPFNAWFFPGV